MWCRLQTWSHQTWTLSANNSCAWPSVVLLCPRNINLEHTSDHISRSSRDSRGPLSANACVCHCLFPCIHTGLRVCVHRSVCVGVFDLLTHVLNWNSRQSARCSTNRIRSWWCQPRFFTSLFPFSARYALTRQTGPSGYTEWNWLMKAEWPLIPRYDNSDDWFYIQWKSRRFLKEADKFFSHLSRGMVRRSVGRSVGRTVVCLANGRGGSWLVSWLAEFLWESLVRWLMIHLTS